MTYMLLLNCALNLVEEIIIYYDARSKKHQIQHTCQEDIEKLQIQLRPGRVVNLTTRLLYRQERALLHPLVSELFHNKIKYGEVILLTLCKVKLI